MQKVNDNRTLELGRKLGDEEMQTTREHWLGPKGICMYMLQMSKQKYAQKLCDPNKTQMWFVSTSMSASP